jgi:hypothetical protein
MFGAALPRQNSIRVQNGPGFEVQNGFERGFSIEAGGPLIKVSGLCPVHRSLIAMSGSSDKVEGGLSG